MIGVASTVIGESKNIVSGVKNVVSSVGNLLGIGGDDRSDTAKELGIPKDQWEGFTTSDVWFRGLWYKGYFATAEGKSRIPYGMTVQDYYYELFNDIMDGEKYGDGRIAKLYPESLVLTGTTSSESTTNFDIITALGLKNLFSDNTNDTIPTATSNTPNQAGFNMSFITNPNVLLIGAVGFVVYMMVKK